MKNVFSAAVIFFLALSGCEHEHYPLIPGQVRETIESAGRNNIEFMEAVVEFRHPDDSLKLKSLFYLVGGMRGEGYKTFLLQDTSRKLIDYNIRHASSYDSLVALKDSLRNVYGKLHFERHYFGRDVYKITSPFLISHVNRRYRDWQDNKWLQPYSFGMFTEKILPYRQHFGPHENWDSIVRDTLLPGFQVSTDDPLLAADRIYAELKNFLSWDARYTENPTDPGWQEMKSDRKGRTEDMAALLVAAFRSYSIAAAIDFCPLPLESREQPTYWVQAFSPDGRRKHFIPFKKQLDTSGRFPKIFRRTYHTYNNPLPEKTPFLNLKYHHLRDGKYRDVTHEYNETVSLQIPRDSIPGRHDFSRVFLHVEYNNQWIPVAWKYYMDKMLFFKITPGFRYALFDEKEQILYQTLVEE
ncbi:MAG: hypothetical protein ACQESX_06160 [Bacteroidota bacterium]